MSSAVVFVLFVIYERPGLGIGHFLYISIALAAMAGRPAWGPGRHGCDRSTCRGCSSILRMPSHEILTAGTFTRLATYVCIGALIGWFASRNRTMMGELRVLAERDTLTGLPNTRAFEAAITRRIRIRDSFRLAPCRHGLARGVQPGRRLCRGERGAAEAGGEPGRRMSPSDDVAQEVTSSPC